MRTSLASSLALLFVLLTPIAGLAEECMPPLCKLSDGTCGVEIEVNTCKPIFQASCEQTGLAWRNNTCCYPCGPDDYDCGPELAGQCIDLHHAACLLIPCEWKDGKCNCQKTCEEAGGVWKDNTCVIPEPATLVLAGLGFSVMAIARRWRRGSRGAPPPSDP